MSKPAAVIVNNTDANIVLPKFFLSKADQEAKDGKGQNAQKVTLGAAMDRGVVNMPQPEHSLTAYAFNMLKQDTIVQALVQRKQIEFRAPGLDILAT